MYSAKCSFSAIVLVLLATSCGLCEDVLFEDKFLGQSFRDSCHLCDSWFLSGVSVAVSAAFGQPALTHGEEEEEDEK